MKRVSLRSMTLRIWLLIWLVLVWILLWGDVSVANAIGGLAIAGLITVLLPMPAIPTQGRVHPISLANLVIRVAWYLVLSSVQVAWLAIRPGAPPPTAVLRAHLHLKSDLVLALAVSILNLIPGSIVLEIDQARRMIYVHVIGVSSQRAVDAFHRQVSQVEKLLVAAFERDNEWRADAKYTDLEAQP